MLSSPPAHFLLSVHAYSFSDMDCAVDDPALVKDDADGEGKIVRNDVDSEDADADA